VNFVWDRDEAGIRRNSKVFPKENSWKSKKEKIRPLEKERNIRLEMAR
jgi:hypothetical protein